MSQIFTLMLLMFGFWFGAIVLQALQRRYAPELGRWTTGWFDPEPPSVASTASQAGSPETNDDRHRATDAERIESLEARIRVLETIVTDRGYQVSEELSDQ